MTTPELARRHNNLDFIRLIAALMVVLGHSFVLTGRGEAPQIFGTDIQTVGVFVFFVISGYLITKSWLRRPQWRTYFAARALRIFPGLIVVTLLSMFIVGPLLTDVSLGTYVRSPLTWGFLNNIILNPTFFLPGVFDHLPYPAVVNGSLWSLPVEFACYIFVPLLMLLPGVWRIVGVTLFGAISGVLVFTLHVPVHLYGFVLQQAVEPWVFFAGGMLIALVVKREWLRVNIAVIAFVALLIVGFFLPGVGHYGLWIVLPYSLLTLGLRSTPVIRRASRFGDLSYGVYIYGFVIQQAFLDVYGARPLWLDLLVVTALTGALAFLSWRFVEEPALRLKTRLEAHTPRRQPTPEVQPN